MENQALNKSLRTILYAPQAKAAERIGIETLQDFARAIERFGLICSHTADGLCYFADHEQAPSLNHFGKLSWNTVLAELTAAGFDWRQHLVKRHPIISEQTDTALRLTLKRRIDELVALLREYQRRNPEL